MVRAIFSLGASEGMSSSVGDTMMPSAAGGGGGAGHARVSARKPSKGDASKKAGGVCQSRAHAQRTLVGVKVIPRRDCHTAHDDGHVALPGVPLAGLQRVSIERLDADEKAARGGWGARGGERAMQGQAGGTPPLVARGWKGRAAAAAAALTCGSRRRRARSR